jgi:hypothetical protein
MSMDMEQKVLAIGSIIIGGSLCVSLLLKYCILPRVHEVLEEKNFWREGHHHSHGPR